MDTKCFDFSFSPTSKLLCSLSGCFKLCEPQLIYGWLCVNGLGFLFWVALLDPRPIPDLRTVWVPSTMTEAKIQSLVDRELLRPKA